MIISKKSVMLIKDKTLQLTLDKIKISSTDVNLGNDHPIISSLWLTKFSGGSKGSCKIF